MRERQEKEEFTYLLTLGGIPIPGMIHSQTLRYPTALKMAQFLSFDKSCNKNMSG